MMASAAIPFTLDDEEARHASPHHGAAYRATHPRRDRTGAAPARASAA